MVRNCGSCTLCCTVLAVEEIGKPPNTACLHCVEGRGCQIYESRPNRCRLFNCHFLENPKLREEWRPSKSRIVLAVSPDGLRIGAHVDPRRPGAWRREPFYSTLKAWAREALSRPSRLGQVYVTIGTQTIVILPDRNVDLGMVEKDEIVLTKRNETPAGPSYEVFKIRRDDPEASVILDGIKQSASKGAIF